MRYYKICYLNVDLTYYIGVEEEIKNTEQLVNYLKDIEYIYDYVTVEEIDKTTEWCEIDEEEFIEGCKITMSE